jgi:hypothetical protein
MQSKCLLTAKRDESLRKGSMGVTGLEHPHENSTDTPLSHENGAKSGVPVRNDPILAALAEAWPTLPEPIRAAVRALVLNSASTWQSPVLC